MCPGLEIYFSAEGDGWDTYLTNDKEGRFITSRYELDMLLENDYCGTIEEVVERIGNYLGRHVEPSREAVYAVIDAFDLSNDAPDVYINLKEFEVVATKKGTPTHCYLLNKSYLCTSKINFNHVISMKQKEYKKPTMEIVELSHRSLILAGSNQRKQSNQQIQDYNFTDVDEE